MTQPSRLALRAVLTLAVGLAAQTAAAQPVPLDVRLGALSERLSLSAEQADALDAIGNRSTADRPSALWDVARQVRGVLTADQVDALRQAPEQDARPRRMGRGDGPGLRPRVRNGAGPRGGRLVRRGERLTEAQRQTLRAVRDDVRARRQTLVERLRAGEVSDQSFADAMRALRQDAAERMAAVRPEADGLRDQRRARRDEAQAARDAALGLTDDQRARLLALRLDAVRDAPDRPDLRPYLDAEGRLDREAMRQATAAQRQARRAAAQERRQQAAEVLTDEQRDLLAVHRALATAGRGQLDRRGRR